MNKKIATIYKGNYETVHILFNRVWAMPNAWTFAIGPIAELLGRYVKNGKGWIDPFCGRNSPAELKNDMNPEIKADFHLEAISFANKLRKKYQGILFDPPYSFRQISEHYKSLSMKATQMQTSMAFYEKAKSAFADKIKLGGVAISCGWNSNGFGKARGYEIIEILIVAHGGSKNDTIVTVEKKVKN